MIPVLSLFQPSCLVCVNGPAGSTVKLSDTEGRTEAFER